MTDDRDHWLGILRHNQGFSNPERWVSYARSHGFQRVAAEPMRACPDCDGAEASVLGQYVYYSTLVRLRSCASCGLAYADTRIDPRIIRRHFEAAYKDEDYFSRRREPIFRHLARLVDSYAPPGGNVIDIGGAQGHLLAAVRARRPDLELTLSDVSEKTCARAAAAYDLDVIRASVGELSDLDRRFDVILIIDVLYYEPEVRKLWQTVERLRKEDCTLLLRVPHRLGMIALQHRLRPFLVGRDREQGQTSIPYFNPEHVAVFSRSYLRHRLTGLGFSDVRFLPSPLLRFRGVRGLLGAALYEAAAGVHTMTRGVATLTPCSIVVARSSRR